MQVAEDFGLSVSFPKTKLMVERLRIKTEPPCAYVDDTTMVESVCEFPYLVSVVDASGRMNSDIDRIIAQASKAFGTLCKSVFSDKHLLVQTKWKIYQSCVLSVLLYGSECWTLLSHQKQKLESFHHRCLRTANSGNSISPHRRSDSAGETQFTQKVAAHCLEWLGHLAQVPERCLPQSVSLAGYPNPVLEDQEKDGEILSNLTFRRSRFVPETQWYNLARTSRQGWHATCMSAFEERRARQQEGAQLATLTPVVCQECKRTFRRKRDRKRHKCTSETLKPVCEQLGPVQCQACHRWFWSRGGHAVHRCRPDHN